MMRADSSAHFAHCLQNRMAPALSECSTGATTTLHMMMTLISSRGQCIKPPQSLETLGGATTPYQV